MFEVNRFETVDGKTIRNCKVRGSMRDGCACTAVGVIAWSISQ